MRDYEAARRRHVTRFEAILPEYRDRIEWPQEVWDVPIASGHGMSEGIFAGSCGHASHLPDDLCVFEPVVRTATTTRCHSSGSK